MPRAPALRQPAAVERPTPRSSPPRYGCGWGDRADPGPGRGGGRGFGRHPDAETYTSQPGLGPVLGARVLAEFGDDPHRHTDTTARRKYAGPFPITRACGRKAVVLARYARNRRLGDAMHQGAFGALTASPGPRLLRHPPRPAAPATTPPYANSPTASSATASSAIASSASSTAASQPEPATTRPLPGPSTPSPLDTPAHGTSDGSYERCALVAVGAPDAVILDLSSRGRRQ